MIPPKLAIYLDCCGTDPIAACDVVEAELTNVVLRRVWGEPLAKTSDAACCLLRNKLTNNNLSVIAIAADVGNAEVSTLPKITSLMTRETLLAAYFGAKELIVTPGKLGSWSLSQSMNLAVEWIELCQGVCKANGINLLVEPTWDSVISTPEALHDLVRQVPNIRLLFDPTAFIIKRAKVDIPAVLSPILDNVFAVDIRDHKTGVGAKPVGHGDVAWKALSPLLHPDVWCFLEPVFTKIDLAGVMACVNAL